LSFSQNGYPKELIKGTLVEDTGLVALTYHQIREVNKGLQERYSCKVILGETERLVLQQDSLLKDGTALVNNLNAQIAGYDQIVDMQNKKYTLKDQEYQKSIKQKNFQKGFFGTVIGILVGGLIAVTIYAVTK